MVDLVVFRSSVVGFRAGLCVDFVFHALAFHSIVNDTNPGFEGSARCSIRCVCLFIGHVHGIAVDSFHGEVLDIRVLLHS